jgi:hypothetical protein
MRTKIEGEPSKRFRVYYADIENNPYECEAEYGTVAEVFAHGYRLDRRYKIRVGGKYLTRDEFRKWATEQGG